MLSLSIHNLGDVAVFQCSGRIVLEDERQLRQAVLSQAPLRIAVLDLAEVSAIDAAGVGALLALHAWASSNRSCIKLMNLTPRVEEILQVTNLRSKFAICSVPEMIDLLCRASRLHQRGLAATITAA